MITIESITHHKQTAPRFNETVFVMFTDAAGAAFEIEFNNVNDALCYAVARNKLESTT
jgi:hypothetical protein